MVITGYQWDSTSHKWAVVYNDDPPGDSRGVQDQLRDVRRICASAGAFAATLADGSVVTWGNPRHGGDCCLEHGGLNIEGYPTLHVHHQ